MHAYVLVSQGDLEPNVVVRCISRSRSVQVHMSSVQVRLMRCKEGMECRQERATMCCLILDSVTRNRSIALLSTLIQ